MTASEASEHGQLAALYWKVFGILQIHTMSEWVNLTLSMAQLKLLMVLAFRGPATISELSDLLNVGLPTVSHLVEKLVNLGFAERVGDPDDRRYIRARVTALGQEMALRLRQGSGDPLQDWLTQLSDADFAALQQGLHALIKVAQASDAESHFVEHRSITSTRDYC